MASRGRPPSTPESFWARVEKTEGCWWWRGAKSKGYGRLSWHGRQRFAHQVAFFLEHGRWPPVSTLHTCDQPSCVRPNHLTAGTQLDNIGDAASKGRMARKLTVDDVVEIRRLHAAGWSSRRIADRFGVRHFTIEAACSRRTWKHVP